MLILLLQVNITKANSIKHDSALWVPILLELPVTDKTDITFFSKQQINNNFQDISLLMNFLSVNYKLTDNLKIGTGAGFYLFEDNNSLSGEFSLYQSLQYFRQLNSQWSIYNLASIEEIFSRHSEGSIRLWVRNFTKLSYQPSFTKKYYLYASVEPWLQANDDRDFGMNGLNFLVTSAGIGKKLNNYITFELGYSPVFYRNRENNHKIEHTIMTNVFVKLPQLLKSK